MAVNFRYKLRVSGEVDVIGFGTNGVDRLFRRSEFPQLEPKSEMASDRRWHGSYHKIDA